MLAVELQVEASQRLAGAVDDLLDGEVRAALFDDDRLGRVQESLDSLGCPEFRRLDGAFDSALLPGRIFRRAGHSTPMSSAENMHELYLRRAW